MKVTLCDIYSQPTKRTCLPDVNRLWFNSGVRSKVVGIYADPDGITIHLNRGFAVTGDAVTEEYAWRRAVIVEPPCSV